MSDKSKNILLGVLIVGLVSMTVAYAALSATLNITINKVTQNAVTWNVAFATGTVTPTVGGTGDVGRSCGNATVTATTVTVSNTTLSKPDDSCTYQLTIKNNGKVINKVKLTVKQDVKKANIIELYFKYLGDIASGNMTL